MFAQVNTSAAILHRTTQTMRLGVYSPDPLLCGVQDVLTGLDSFLALLKCDVTHLVVLAQLVDDNRGPHCLLALGPFWPALTQCRGPVIELLRLQLSILCNGNVPGLSFKTTNQAVFDLTFIAVPGDGIQYMAELLICLGPEA